MLGQIQKFMWLYQLLFHIILSWSNITHDIFPQRNNKIPYKNFCSLLARGIRLTSCTLVFVSEVSWPTVFFNWSIFLFASSFSISRSRSTSYNVCKSEQKKKVSDSVFSYRRKHNQHEWAQTTTLTHYFKRSGNFHWCRLSSLCFQFIVAPL